MPVRPVLERIDYLVKEVLEEKSLPDDHVEWDCSMTTVVEHLPCEDHWHERTTPAIGIFVKLTRVGDDEHEFISVGTAQVAMEHTEDEDVTDVVYQIWDSLVVMGMEMDLHDHDDFV